MTTFSVHWFDAQDCSHTERQGVDAKTAVEFAKELTERPAVALGIIRRVIITDDGDCINFEWKHGEGVTYPPRPAPMFKVTEALRIDDEAAP